MYISWFELLFISPIILNDAIERKNNRTYQFSMHWQDKGGPKMQGSQRAIAR
jgi:hypothetical protein